MNAHLFIEFPLCARLCGAHKEAVMGKPQAQACLCKAATAGATQLLLHRLGVPPGGASVLNCKTAGSYLEFTHPLLAPARHDSHCQLRTS